MKNVGISSRVNQPTEWCAGMVMILKVNGKVHICVDLTKVNESIERERDIDYAPLIRP